MPWTWSECEHCHRTLRRGEWEWFDDPMAPFGPERLCRHCGGLATRRHHQLLIGLAVIAVAALGFGIPVALGWYRIE